MKLILSFLTTIFLSLLSFANRNSYPGKIIVEIGDDEVPPLAYHINLTRSKNMKSTIDELLLIEDELIVKKSSESTLEQLIEELEEVTHRKIKIRAISPEELRLGTQDDMT